MREGSGRGRVVGPLFPDQWLCPQLPWLLPPPLFPPFPGHIRLDSGSGHSHSARSALLCRGHLGRGAPSAADWGCHFSQLTNGQGHRRGRGGGLTFLWTWGRPALTFRGKKTKGADWFSPMACCKMKTPLYKMSGSAEGWRERIAVGWAIVCWHTVSHRTLKKMNVCKDSQAQIVDFS